MPTSSSSAIARVARLATRSTGRCVRIVSIELAPDRVQRIERGQRILEDRADLAAADAAHRLVGQRIDAPAGEQDAAGRDATRADRSGR